MRTIVIGLGNPILGDDGIGWRVAQTFSQSAYAKENFIEVDCVSVGGLSLMERLVGYDQVILVDGIQTKRNPIGTVSVNQLEDFPVTSSAHMNSAHDVNISTALQLGREMGVQLPKRVYIVSIEAQRIYDFSDELSPTLTAVIPFAVQRIQDLHHNNPNPGE